MGISSTNHIAVVVLNWNGLEDTLQCLASLEVSDFDSFDIVIVDNASTEPSTIERLEHFVHESTRTVTLLRNSKNLGFSGGVNTGIRHALAMNYSHIALINNDATVSPSWLSTLFNTFEVSDDIGIVTGSLLHKNTATIDSTGEIYSVWGLPFPRLRSKPASRLPQSGFVFAATGGATLYRREVFETVGLFDEKFFAYYEDVDIGFRAQLMGWKAYYQQNAIAHHTQGASSSKISGFTTKQAIRNLPLLFIKNVPLGLGFTVGLRFLCAYTLITLKAVLGQHSKQAFAGWLQGIWLFWTHGIPSRFAIQRRRTVKTAAIKELLWHDLPPDQTGLRKLLGRPVK